MDNQVVIVTGGGRGIGFGIGECFAERKASILVADVDLEAARGAADRLNSGGAVGCIGVKCDVTCCDQVDAMVRTAVETFGRIDVLVNNAGICPFVDVMELTPQIWQKTLDINLSGPFHCTQAVAREMIRRGKGGRIICITSLSEHFTNPTQVDYAASKSGLRMMMVGFASALGRYGITCNAVAPGMILTDMTKHHWLKPGPAEYIKTRAPMGRMGTPIDIGRACVYLASPEADYVSGISLRVDGGYMTMSP
jgi:NAD(P)-dependent dehydrogenase (short-subunit alcohol dehydrogenase family)